MTGCRPSAEEQTISRELLSWKKEFSSGFCFNKIAEASQFVVHLQVYLINLHYEGIQLVPAHQCNRSASEKVAERQKLFQRDQQFR